MNGLKYTLQLLEPVLANSLAGDTNSATSLPYIPGGLVRGMLAHAWLGGRSLTPNSSEEETFRRLFVRPDTRYLNAYEEIEGQRALPTPLSWRASKGRPEADGFPVYDLALELPDKDDLETVEFKFNHRPAANVIYYVSSLRQVHIHTQRDAVLGRAIAGRGAVYRYESLPAGTHWHGIILTENPDDVETLASLLTNTSISLGKARSAGYGRALAESVEPVESDWREMNLHSVETSRSRAYDDEEEEEDLQTTPPIPSSLSQFRLVFLSPALVRDEAGQFSLDPQTALQTRMGRQIEIAAAFRQADLVGGFNRRWGNHVPQQIAIAAGSVFVCRAPTPIEWTLLAQLETTGVGERRGEGFGRIAVEWSEPVSLSAFKTERAKPPAADRLPLSPPAEALARMMMRRMLRRRLDEGLQRAAHNYKVISPPAPSQIGRWRVIVRNALAEQNAANPPHLDGLRAFADRERKRNSRAWQRMNNTRLQLLGQDDQRQTAWRMTAWIDALLSASPDTEEAKPNVDKSRHLTLWRLIAGQENAPQQTLGTLVETADEALRAEYTLRLIDEVLQIARDAAVED